MNVYALNVTPMNGNAIVYGRGAAAQVLSASGRAALMICARPAASSMGMPSFAAGILARIGRGLAQMALTARSRGYLMLCGVGDVAIMALAALADGRVIPVARGTSMMVLGGAARGALALLGDGTARMPIGGAGRLTRATLGAGMADLVLSGTLGIPNPMQRPGVFSRAHHSRWSRVDGSADAMKPAAAERTAAIACEPRTIHVEPERNH